MTYFSLINIASQKFLRNTNQLIEGVRPCSNTIILLQITFYFGGKIVRKKKETMKERSFYLLSVQTDLREKWLEGLCMILLNPTYFGQSEKRHPCSNIDVFAYSRKTLHWANFMKIKKRLTSKVFYSTFWCSEKGDFCVRRWARKNYFRTSQKAY